MSRPVTLSIAMFFGTAVSIDPSVRAVTPEVVIASADRAVVGAEPRREAHGLGQVTGPAATDVTVEVTPETGGAYRVVVGRRGYLVSLRDESARAAGVDWTAVRVAAASHASTLVGALVWETTTLDGRETERGLVRLRGEGGPVAAEIVALPAPEIAGTWKGARASCTSQHDGFSGFTVFCRPAKGVRVTGVANVTSARSLDDAWLVAGTSPLIRLDLARSPGPTPDDDAAPGAEGRVIGLVHGATGIVLTVEASFLDGEQPALVFHEAERTQPTPSF
jgi:hypothetical protein